MAPSRSSTWRTRNAVSGRFVVHETVERAPKTVTAGASGTSRTTAADDDVPDRGRDLERELVETFGGDWTVVPATADVSWHTAMRAGVVVEALGGTRATAKALGVAPSQVSRWARGAQRPELDAARRLLDLDHVIAQAQLLWADNGLVRDWLTTYNAHLGARPIDVVTLRGAAEVVEAIKAELSGAFA